MSETSPETLEEAEEGEGGAPATDFTETQDDQNDEIDPELENAYDYVQNAVEVTDTEDDAEVPELAPQPASEVENYQSEVDRSPEGQERTIPRNTEHDEHDWHVTKSSPQDKQLPFMQLDDERMHILVINEGLVFRDYYKQLASESGGMFKVTTVGELEFALTVLRDPLCRVAALVVDLRDGIKKAETLLNELDKTGVRIPCTLVVKYASQVDQDQQLASCVTAWARRMPCLLAEFPFPLSPLVTKLHILIEQYRKGTDIYEGVRSKSILRNMGRYKNEHRENWMREQVKYASIDDNANIAAVANMQLSPRRAASRAGSAASRRFGEGEESVLPGKGSSVLNTPSIFDISIEEGDDPNANRFRKKIRRDGKEQRGPINLDELPNIPADVEGTRREYAVENYLKYRSSAPHTVRPSSPISESGNSAEPAQTEKENELCTSLDAQWMDPLRSNAVLQRRIVSAKDMRKGTRNTSVIGSHEAPIKDIFNASRGANVDPRLSGNRGAGIIYDRFASENKTNNEVEDFVKLMEATDEEGMKQTREVLSRLSHTRSKKEILDSERRSHKGEVFPTEAADSTPMNQAWQQWMAFDMLKGDTVGPPVDNLNDCSPAFRWIMRGIGKLYGTDRHEDAEALFSQAIRADPSCSTAYHMRAVARIKLGKYEAALQDLDASLLKDPSVIAKTLLSSTSVHTDQGSMQVSESGFAEKTLPSGVVSANIANPNDPLSRLVGTHFPAGQGGLQRSYEQSEKLKRCKEYGSAIAISTSSVSELEGSKRAGVRSSQSKSLSWLTMKKMLPNQPRDSIVKALYNRAYVFTALGDHFAALDDLNDLLQLDQSFGPALCLRAILKRRQGDEFGASEDYIRMRNANDETKPDTASSRGHSDDPEELMAALKTLNISFDDHLIDVLGIRRFLDYQRKSEASTGGELKEKSDDSSSNVHTQQFETHVSSLEDGSFERARMFKDLILTAAHQQKKAEVGNTVQTPREILLKEATSEQRNILESLPLPGKMRVPAGVPQKLPWNARKKVGQPFKRKDGNDTSRVKDGTDSKGLDDSHPTVDNLREKGTRDANGNTSNEGSAVSLDLSDVVSGSKDVYSAIVCRPTDAQLALQKATKERKKHDIEVIQSLMQSLIFFRCLDKQAQRDIAERLRYKSYKDSETICEENENFPYFSIVMTGQVLVRVSVPTGDVNTHFVVDHLRTGDYFGELTMLYGKHRTLLCTSEGPTTELLLLHADDFYKVGLDKTFQEHISLKQDKLRRCNAFEKWRDDELHWPQLACIARVKTFRKYQTIITQNALPSNFFVLTKGICSVYRSGDALDLEKKIRDTEEELNALKYAGAYHRGMRNSAQLGAGKLQTHPDNTQTKSTPSLSTSAKTKSTEYLGLSTASLRKTEIENHMKELEEENTRHHTRQVSYEAKTAVDEKRKRTENHLHHLIRQRDKMYAKQHLEQTDQVGLRRASSSKSLRSKATEPPNRIDNLSKRENRLRQRSSRLLRSGDSNSSKSFRPGSGKDKGCDSPTFGNFARPVEEYQDSRTEGSDSCPPRNQYSSHSNAKDGIEKSDRRLLIETLYPPTIFGELAILAPWDGFERASVVAETYCEVLCIPRSEIDHSLFTDERKEDIKRRAMVYPDDNDILKKYNDKKKWNSFRREMLETINKSKWPIDKNKLKQKSGGKQVLID